MPQLAALEAVLREQSWTIIFLARLSPVFPMSIFGYCVGATSVSMSSFASASFFGFLPGCILYAWIGAAATQAGDGYSSAISIAISVCSTVAMCARAHQLIHARIALSFFACAQLFEGQKSRRRGPGQAVCPQW